MMNNCNLDERQLWIRGDVYKHIIFYLAGLLILDAFLKDFDVIWAVGRYSSLIILFVSVMAGAIEMIIRDVFVMSKSQKFGIYFMGISNAILFAITVSNMITKKVGMIEQGHLTNYGSGLILHGSAVVVLVVFFCNFIYYKMMEIEEN